MRAVLDYRRLLMCSGQGIVHLHGLAIVHGDLKPANVLLDAEGRPRISDWGLSRLSHGVTRTGMKATTVSYTDGYAAPEVVAGRRRTRESDMCVVEGWLCVSAA